MSYCNEDMNEKEKLLLIKKVVFGIGVSVLALIIYANLNPFVIIGAGERGVVLRFGAIQDAIKPEGLAVRIPIVEKIVKVDVKIHKCVAKVAAASKDLQDIHTSIALNYRVNPMVVNKLWQNIGIDFENRVVEPTIQESVKAVVAQYTAEQLIQQRTLVKTKIQDLVAARISKNYLIMDAVFITNFEFSECFNIAIEAKQQAEQLSLKAIQDLARIRIEADQSIATARATAEALRLQKEQITPQLLELRKVETQVIAIKKWNGVLPMYTGGGVIPFIEMYNKSRDYRR